MIDATPQELAEIRAEAGADVIVTPLVYFSVARLPTFPAHARQIRSLQEAKFDDMGTVRIRVLDESGQGVEGVGVVGTFSSSASWGTRAETNSEGIAHLEVPSPVGYTHFESLSFYPRHSFWPTYRIGVRAADQDVTLKDLPSPIGYEWWAETLKAPQAHSRNVVGQGVRVAVIDTGIGPHPDLSNIADGLNFTVEGSPADYRDVDGHGTHVAGIIGARSQMVGIAPEAQLFAARVFAREGDALNGDVAEAIRVAVDDWRCDVLNLSLGGPYDELVEDRINYASNNGVLCVAAAGNSAAAVEYPGALREAVCVGAVGVRGTYPVGSIHELAEPLSRGLEGANDFFAARFTCFGDEVNACAPGVAIISTVPNSNYAVFDGTSMAAPMVSGVAALVLAQHPSLADRSPLGYGGGARRTAILRAELRGLLSDVHLPRAYQGEGIPVL